ncbi:hypothetical protein Pen02_56100 [Plantactinospora endophytica]|uniref:Uncharacterized protein n=1 Tax=Plantactinospora endophytica TaxID=673535 RepID=A0ABQ4E7J2_9ACTN|nr:hypothetical protein Pen02_56100 [Plantactinospora endophytica]
MRPPGDGGAGAGTGFHDRERQATFVQMGGGCQADRTGSDHDHRQVCQTIVHHKLPIFKILETEGRVRPPGCRGWFQRMMGLRRSIRTTSRQV